MRFDYHTHTPLCHHASGSPTDLARAARDAGLGEIGFSDHCPMPTQYDDWRMAPDELPVYLDLVEEARRAVPGISIKLGLECDYLPGFENHIRALRTAAPFDYFIGSVHYVTPEWDIDSPMKLSRWGSQPVEETWRSYFQCLAAAAASGLFDIIGHADLCKKFGHVPSGPLEPYYRPALDAIAAHGLCIEINTSGWHKDIAEAYPSPRFLAMAFESGIPIVISSDAHAPGEVGRDFDRARDLAWKTGYREVQRFTRGKREPVPLESF